MWGRVFCAPGASHSGYPGWNRLGKELLSHTAGETTLGGLTGWRLFLGIVGVIALFWGFVTLLTTVDPRFEGKEFEAVVRTNQRSYWSLLKSFFTKPAMAGIIAQVAG